MGWSEADGQGWSREGIFHSWVWSFSSSFVAEHPRKVHGICQYWEVLDLDDLPWHLVDSL